VQKRERHIAATLPLFGQGSQTNGKHYLSNCWCYHATASRA
jgi:hypothetical protein